MSASVNPARNSHPPQPADAISNLHIQEAAINVISEGTRVEGKVIFDELARVHGTLVGDVQGKDGSTLVLSETAVVEGTIHADTLMIDGYVHGDIFAKTRVVISRTGRVVGNVKTPSLIVEFGAFFEGLCNMEGAAVTSNPAAAPA